MFPLGVDKLRESFASTEELEGPSGPLSAREAFELAEEIIFTFDAKARLCRVKSTAELALDGMCEGWEFTFALPSRWGSSVFLFQNGPESGTLTVSLFPFAPIGSTLDKMLDEGQAGFVEQQWMVELERKGHLSHSFPDSPIFMKKFLNERTDIVLPEGSVLRATISALGSARWELMESSQSKKSLYTLAIE